MQPIPSPPEIRSIDEIISDLYSAEIFAQKFEIAEVKSSDGCLCVEIVAKNAAAFEEYNSLLHWSARSHRQSRPLLRLYADTDTLRIVATYGSLPPIRRRLA